jgi:hypothetical protein
VVAQRQVRAEDCAVGEVTLRIAGHGCVQVGHDPVGRPPTPRNVVTVAIMNAFRQIIARYEGWESRRVQRLSGWPRRRRWLVFVLLPVMLFCGGGTAIGIPIMWAIGLTADASKGAANPEAAVNIYLIALGYRNDDGLLPVLDDDQDDALMRQWNAYLAETRRGGTQPSKLDFDFRGQRQLDARHVEVIAGVSPVWWNTSGGATAMQGQRQDWRFRTHEDHGWQIDKVTPFPWCGGYITPEACRGSR